MPQNNETHQRKTVIDGLKNWEKKGEQEVQNTLKLKSGGKSCIRKCQPFQEYE